MNFTRKSGILLHPTSLPGKYGIGTIGQHAYSFIDFLVASGQKIWQTCPLGHTGFGDSPYQCFSAFAGNPLLINLEEFVIEGFLNPRDLTIDDQFNDESVDFGAVFNWKYPLLRKACDLFIEKAGKSLKRQFERFITEENNWLHDYALFMALKDFNGGKAWHEWSDDFKLRNPDAINDFEEKYQSDIIFYKFIQFFFFKQWSQLKAYANQNYIEIIGDIPLYVAYDSAEAWANPELFLFDEDKKPTMVAGVPPDYFSETGQLWGNPIYNWEYMQDNHFEWWKSRIRASLKLADIIRIDHFRGLAAYWAVPYGSENAINGQWYPSPGRELFEALEYEFGKLPILAEDLGVITEDVTALRDMFELPGMKILQFAFDSDEDNSANFFPHVYDKNSVVYTGTHDNDTVIGWFDKAKDIDKKYALKYLNTTEKNLSLAFLRAAWSSTAVFAIAPMQDILGLDSKARMNTPGILGGNWQWRVTPEQLSSKVSDMLNELTKIYQR